MKKLSRWASRHAPLAITLIILGEVVNGYSGVMLGATLLNEVSLYILHAGIAILVSLAAGVRLLSRTNTGRFSVGRWCLFGAFLGNFLLFGLLGGLMAPRSQPHNVAVGAWGSRRVEVRADTLARPNTLRPVKQSVTATNAARSSADGQAGKRIGYGLLFGLSFILTYLMTALACNIACSGYGFLAVVVFLLGLGFLAGGIYFLGRALDKQVTKRSDMTPDQRRRTGRRFWLSWVILIGLTVVSLLISAVSD